MLDNIITVLVSTILCSSSSTWCQGSNGSSPVPETESELYLVSAEDNGSQWLKVDLKVDEGNAGLTPHFTVNVLQPITANDFYAYFYTITPNREFEVEYSDNLCGLMNDRGGRDEKEVPELYKKVEAVVFPGARDCRVPVSSRELPDLVPFETSENSVVELRVYPKESVGQDDPDEKDSILTVVYLICKDKNRLGDCLSLIIGH